VRTLDLPFPTVTAVGSQGAIAAAFLARHYGGHENDGSSLGIPFHTVTSRDHHALVAAFLMKYYGTDQAPQIFEPLDTITTKDRFGLVTVQIAGETYRIVDIGMRMLKPRELYRAQSFPDSYIIDRDDEGNPFTVESQVRMCGNSVPPAVAEALVRANIVEQRQERAA
jgi:DNA (cytosine-5)-methyltransferase 1